jgi:hypothetical protein
MLQGMPWPSPLALVPAVQTHCRIRDTSESMLRFVKILHTSPCFRIEQKAQLQPVAFNMLCRNPYLCSLAVLKDSPARRPFRLVALPVSPELQDQCYHPTWGRFDSFGSVRESRKARRVR